MILPGSASQSLAAELATMIGEQLAVVERQSFADGEFVLRAPDAGGERAVVVASTVSAAAHVELLQLQDLARRNFEKVVTVLPYMGYARQDEVFREGQPVTAEAVARAVSTSTDRVVTVNPHEDRVLEFFEVPAEAVDASPRLADPLPSLEDPLFLAPDTGATAIAAAVRDAHGAGETDHFEKHRDHETGEVSICPSAATAAGRDVVLVDDIVATGGTMSSAIAQLVDPASVHVACVHPVFAGSARSRLADVGVNGVYATDTVERAASAVSAAPAVARALR